MQKENWICYSVSTSTQGEKMLIVNAYTPFGDQVGPCVQFDGAFFGQNPARSLKAAKVRSTEAYAIMKQLTRLRLRARQCVDPDVNIKMRKPVSRLRMSMFSPQVPLPLFGSVCSLQARCLEPPQLQMQKMMRCCPPWDREEDRGRGVTRA